MEKKAEKSSAVQVEKKLSEEDTIDMETESRNKNVQTVEANKLDSVAGRTHNDSLIVNAAARVTNARILRWEKSVVTHTYIYIYIYIYMHSSCGNRWWNLG